MSITTSIRVREQAGFTLIETIIAAMLFMVVVAVAVALLGVVRGAVSTSLSTSSTQAGSQSARLLLRSDLTKMRAPGRGIDTTAMIGELAGLCPPGSWGNCSTVDASTPYSRLHDITHLSSTQLGFWADVLSAPGTEHVTWRLVHSTDTRDADWRIERTVRRIADSSAWNGTFAPVALHEVVQQGFGQPPSKLDCPSGAGPRLFCFRELSTNGSSAGGGGGTENWSATGCADRWDGPWNGIGIDGKPLTWSESGTLSIRALGSSPRTMHRADRIVQVASSIGGTKTRGRGQARSTSDNWITLPNRATTRYQQAIMCGRQ